MTKAERNYALLLAVIAVVVSVPVYVVCRAYGVPVAHAVTFGAMAVTVVNLGMAAWNLSRLPKGPSQPRKLR